MHRRTDVSTVTDSRLGAAQKGCPRCFRVPGDKCPSKWLLESPWAAELGNLLAEVVVCELAVRILVHGRGAHDRSRPQARPRNRERHEKSGRSGPASISGSRENSAKRMAQASNDVSRTQGLDSPFDVNGKFISMPGFELRATEAYNDLRYSLRSLISFSVSPNLKWSL